MSSRVVTPVAGPLEATVRVPGSKSLTNRALVAAALARGRSQLEGALLADDTEAMLDGLRRLGIEVAEDRVGQRITLAGCGGTLPGAATGATLDARLSGTTARFLLPVLSLGSGPTTLDGAAPLRVRPMADGIAALRALGAHVDELGDPGHLPVIVRGPAWTGVPDDPDGVAGPADPGRTGGEGPSGASRPARVTVAGEASSQFLSGLLLAGPAWPGGLEVVAEGSLVSRPYVDMTVAVMRAFGADVTPTGASASSPGDESPGAGGPAGSQPVASRGGGWRVAPTGYAATRYRIEPDASAASYLFAAAAICGGQVTVDGLGRGSLQGDLRFVDVLERMGCHVERGSTATTVARTGPLHGVEVDMGDLSDTAQTLAAVAVFADSPTRVTGIGFIRAKETDRVGNVVRELRRCGIDADEEPDGFLIRPGRPQPGVTVQTYDDHRMAMSFALLGLRGPGIAIADPDCVAKTFPGYWDALDRLRSPGRRPAGR